MEQKLLILEDLNFHDCNMYSFGFDSDNYELLFDIDLILQWHTEKPKWKFSVCPVTIVFKNVYDIEMDINSNTQLIMDDIIKSNPRVPKNIEYLPAGTLEYDWNFDLIVGGEIRFKSIGMTMYQRKEPIVQRGQALTLKGRGGFSLNKEGIIILNDFMTD